MRPAPLLKWSGLALVVLIAAAALILLSVDVGSYREDIEAEFRKASGRDLVIGGDINLSISLNPALVAEQISIANADWGSRPAMVALTRAEAEVELLPLLAGDIRITRLILVEPDILLERNAAGQPNWRPETAPASEAAAPASDEAERKGKADDGPPPAPIFNHVELRGGRLLYRDARTGEETRLDLERVSAKAASFDAPLEIDAAGAWNEAPFRLSGRADSPARIAAREPVEIAFRAALADSDLSGRVELASAGPRPRLSGALEARVIDLGRLRPDTAGSRPSAAEDGGGRPDRARPDRVFSDDPLSLKGLSALDLDLTLSIRTLAGYPVSAGPIEARVKLDDGALAVEPFRATLAGSPLEGAFRLDASQALLRFRLAARTDGFDLGRLLKETGVSDVFEGQAKASANLAGDGRSIAALMAGLDGDIRVVSGGGRLKMRASDAAAGGAGALLGALFPGGRQWTVVNCAILSVGIEKGRAISRAALIDTEYSTVAARGAADMGSETLDLVVEPRAKSATLNVAVPVHVRGRFSDPEFRPDPGAVLKTLGGLVGIALFPPAAIADLVELGGGDNECLKTATGAEADAAMQPGSPSPEKATREFRDNLKGAVKDIGRGLRDLFRGGKE